MKLGLKIITLLFFISGIVFFVGYQSRYFFPNEPNESVTPNEEMIKSSIESDIEDSRTGDTVILEEEKDRAPKVVAKKQEEQAEELTPNQIRAYSSKSVHVQFRDLPTDNELRMSSSKSTRMVRPITDLFKPDFLKNDNPLRGFLEFDTLPEFVPNSNGPYNPYLDTLK